MTENVKTVIEFYFLFPIFNFADTLIGGTPSELLSPAFNMPKPLFLKGSVPILAIVIIWPKRTLGSFNLKDLVNLSCLKNGFISIKDCVLYEWKIAGSFILKDWKNQAFFSVNLIQSRVLEQNPLKRKVWAYWRPTRGVWGCPPDKVIREIKNWETENRTKSQF